MAHLLHLVDKPEGWTSHDVVARLRGILGERRVGHAGTLDPFATGLLVVGEGRATGLLAALGLLPKRYRAVIRLGIATDTQDRTGTPLAADAGETALPTRDALDRVLAEFRGPQTQCPPLYSAVRVRGERLYRAARRGAQVERPERPIHVYSLERLEGVGEGCGEGAGLPEAPPHPDHPGTQDVAVDLTVSRGTYVRTLAHDIGRRLGCGAHLAALRRVSIGPFDVAAAGLVAKGSGWDAARFRAAALEPARALSFLPAVRLGDQETARLRHGAAPAIAPDRIRGEGGGYPLPPGASGWPLALLDGRGDLLALAAPWEEQARDAPLRLLRVVAGEAASPPPPGTYGSEGGAHAPTEPARA